jgi:hypothetical protein
MAISKDESIITQVAAKIAAELTPTTDSVDMNVANWASAFITVRDTLFDAHGDTAPAANPIEAVQQVFPDAQVVQTAPQPQVAPSHLTSVPNVTIGVQVKGKTHGPIPEWLAAEAAKKGITSVWDERDKLSVNPKRPWFRCTDNKDLCLWPPRG